jgi:hypothetical protein
VQAADFKCIDCGEQFEYKAHCILHHLDSKHENFELLATDIKMNIKSK